MFAFELFAVERLGNTVMSMQEEEWGLVRAREIRTTTCEGRKEFVIVGVVRIHVGFDRLGPREGRPSLANASRFRLTIGCIGGRPSLVVTR